MRLAVTVVSPATRRSTDIVLDADPATPMMAVAAALDRFARGGVSGGGDVLGGGGVVGGGDVVPRQRDRPPCWSRPSGPSAMTLPRGRSGPP